MGMSEYERGRELGDRFFCKGTPHLDPLPLGRGEEEKTLAIRSLLIPSLFREGRSLGFLRRKVAN